MTQTRASNSKLEPGTTSIDRAKITKMADGTMRMKWRLCLPDGRVVDRTTQGSSAGQVRARARAKAKEMLATSVTGDWKPGSDLVDYMNTVSKPKIEALSNENTRARHLASLKILQARFKGHTISSGTRFRTMEKVLTDVAKNNGSESARQCRNVLGKYVIQQLIRDEVLQGNPLAGMSIDLSSNKEPEPEIRALTQNEFAAAVAWLLAQDPSEGVKKPARGRWSREDAIAVRRNLIDLALLQAASGLRVTEANELTWDDLDKSANISRSKTHRGRKVPLLFPDVVQHLATRRARGGRYVIGSPTDPDKVWDRDNCRKQCQKFYPEIGDGIDAARDVFGPGRTHLWRKTLNSLMVGVAPEVRAAYFGHSTEVNARYYTDTTDVAPMIEAAKELR